MPNISDHSDSAWVEAEKAAIAGVGYKEISLRFGIAETALRKRASEYQWAVPRRIARLAKEHGVNAGILTNPHKAESGAKTAVSLTSETLAQRAEGYSLTVFDKVSKLATKGLELLPIPDNWKSFAIADQVARRSAGLDKPQQNVSIQLGSFFRPAETQLSDLILDIESDGAQDAGEQMEQDGP